MTRLTRVAVSISAIYGLMLMGCMQANDGTSLLHQESVFEIESARADAEVFDSETYSGPILIEALRFEGRMGDVEDFSGNVWLQRGQHHDNVTSLEVQAESRSENWAAMTMVNIEGGLTHPALEPGAEYTFTRSEYGPDRLYISVVGCSGPTRYVWHYDQTANEVTIRVEQGDLPWQRHLIYTATFDFGYTVTGELEYNIIGGTGITNE